MSTHPSVSKHCPSFCLHEFYLIEKIIQPVFTRMNNTNWNRLKIENDSSAIVRQIDAVLAAFRIFLK